MDTARHETGSNVVAQQQTQVTYCPNHKGTPTNLRCSRCEKLVCPKCMVHGPVGVRCFDCGKPTQLPVYDVSIPQLLRAIGASVVLGVVGGLLLVLLVRPLLFGLLYLAAMAGFGYVVGEGTSYAANRKRGRTLTIAAIGGVLLGQGLTIYLVATVTEVISLFDLVGAGLAIYVAYIRLK